MAKGKKKMTVHKNIRQDGRPNGKKWKQHPKAFDYGHRRLITVDQKDKGESALFL